jgi:dTDP-D-glucose 4,6-dehydratase
MTIIITGFIGINLALNRSVQSDEFVFNLDKLAYADNAGRCEWMTRQGVAGLGSWGASECP